MRYLLPLWLVACGATPAGTSPLPPVSGEEITRESFTEPELRSELLTLRDRDQELRTALIERPEDEATKEEIRAFDERATARAKEILAEHGWPSVEQVGADGSGALWLLVQHRRTVTGARARQPRPTSR